MSSKSGKQIGLVHLATLNSYLSQGNPLPVSSKDGVLNLAELARVTGIPKSSFYQNPAVKLRLEAARNAQGVMRQSKRQPLATPDSSPVTEALPARTSAGTVLLERRLHRLEQQNAALMAENFELRRQVKDLRLQLGREDMMIETGRRISVPAGTS